MNKIIVYKKTMSRIAVCVLSLVLSATLTSCTKKMDCNVKEPHAQKYVDDEGFLAYYQSENEFLNGYTWTEDVRFLDEEAIELQKFLEENRLLLIADNKDKIKTTIEGNNSHLEYEYEYSTMMMFPVMIGKIMYSIPMTTNHTAYSIDSSIEGKTGKVRGVTYEYYGYRVKKQNGKWLLEKSEPVEDLLDISGEYEYFKKEDFCQTVYGEPFEIPKTLKNTN